MDLKDIKLEKNGEHLYIQLFNELKKLITNQTIKDKTKLPPIRDFATSLNVNSVTIINAYKLLEKDGLIYKKVGSGSFVSYKKNSIDIGYMDFSGKDSNIDSFPLKEISGSIVKILEDDGVNAFKYEDPDGYLPLKEALANYFKFYNITTRAELIQIVSGGQQAIDIVSKALLDFGDTVITEQPTYHGAVKSFLSREARIISIDIQKNGLDIDALISKIEVRKPSFIYIMPYNQKPTGVTYSYENRVQLLEIAHKYGFYILEDDLGSELEFDLNNRSLKSLDKYDRVIYIKSFTPLFMPGLRLGCIIPPEKIFNKFLNIKTSTDISTPGLIQRAFTNYLNNNNWNEYYKTLSNNIRSKSLLIKDILMSDFKDLISFDSELNSPHFWIKLLKGDSRRLRDICIIYGIDITPGETIGVDYSNYFLLNTKSIPKENIEPGLIILKKAINLLYLEY